MGRKLNTIVAEVLALATMISCLSVFAFAAENHAGTEELQDIVFF